MWTWIPFGRYLGMIVGTLRLSLVSYAGVFGYRLPELFSDTDCLNCFRNVGKICMLDLNVRGTYPRVGPPGCDLEMVARMPPVPYCRVAEMLSDTVVQRRGCTRMSGCRGKLTFPGRDTGCVGSGCFPG